jgi:hypothetical protein
MLEKIQAMQKKSVEKSLSKELILPHCPTKLGSVANIYKGQAALICGRNYPANAINCL